MSPRSFASRIVPAVLALGLTTAGPAAPALAAGEVNVYSSRHYAADEKLYERFERETGIKVNLVQSKVNALFERLKREGRYSPADVLITVDAGNLGRAKAAGLFQPMREGVADAVPTSKRDPEGHWVGLTMRARVIMYHKERVDPAELSTYEALADPKWKGRILIRSSNNIYNQSLVASLIAAHGTERALEWAKGIVANMARRPKGGDRDQIRAVLAGEGDIAVANTYYLGHMLSGGGPEAQRVRRNIGVFFPNQKGRGAHVNVSGAGLTRHAPNKANGEHLIEFLLRKEAQKVLADANFEYPIRPGVDPHPIVASFGSFRADELNVAELGKFNDEAVRIMDRAGWR